MPEFARCQLPFDLPAFSTRNAFPRWAGKMHARTIPGAFREAADMVVAFALAQRSHPDRFLDPIGTLYRHSLETAIKECSKLGDEVFENPPPKEFYLEHNLVKPWLRVRAYMERRWFDAHYQALECGEAVIRQFQDIDPSAQGFRYATDRRGRPTLHRLPEQVDLVQVQQAVGQTLGLLDEIMIGFDADIEAASDMRWDCRE